jgi:hypothetical protein
MVRRICTAGPDGTCRCLPNIDPKNPAHVDAMLHAPTCGASRPRGVTMYYQYELVAYGMFLFMWWMRERAEWK